LANHNCRLKVSPIKMAPRKTRSNKLIWNVYGFK
jgi:hypothetical protein